jgi:DNA-binding beta-propeller fold protein YncE
MSAIASMPIDAERNAHTSARLFFLDLSGGRVLSANPDGSDLTTVISEGRKLPDGLVLDVAAGHIYWTNMGDPNMDDGSIMRSDLNGKNMITIVPPGGTFTPKQLQLENNTGKLYWSDREGMRVMRANRDGSALETLVDTSLGDSRPGPDPRKWCVGIAVDPDGGKFYWTQKGGHHTGLGRIFRANIQVPQGQSAENRTDIELLYDNLPEPIDLDLDPVNRALYWTDRGGPPRGNTVNRAPMDPDAGNGKEPQILFSQLMEGIGLALDLKGRRMFITDFGGSVYSANLDGSNRKTLLFAQGNLTGIAYAELQSANRNETFRVMEVPEEKNMEDNTLVQSSFSATINAPIEKVDIPSWCFNLPESEYQACSPAHVSAGATTAPDGRRMSINVEVLGGSPLVQHYVEEIGEPHHLRLVSSSDVFTPTGRIKVGVVWDLSVKKIDSNTCEFTNEVHSTFTPELLDALAKQGIPRDVFQNARKPISEAHNQQETPLYAKSIERHALRNGSSARITSAA